MVGVCYTLLSHGRCDNSECAFDHNPLTCETCSFVALSAEAFHGHMGGKKHRKKMGGSTGLLYLCPTCNKSMPMNVWNDHRASHLRPGPQQSLNDAIEPLIQTQLPGQHLCDLCQYFVPVEFWNKHLHGAKHMARQRFTSYRAALDELEKEKNGVTLEGSFDFQIVEPRNASHGVELSSRLDTSVPSSKVSLVEINLASNQGRLKKESPFAFTVVGTNRVISFNKPVLLKLVFKQPYIGRYEDRVEFVLEDVQLRQHFIISRPLRAIVGNKADHEALRPRTPYAPPVRQERVVEREIVEGPPPESLKAVPYVVRLPVAPIPLPLMSLLSTGTVGHNMRRIRDSHLPQILDKKSYTLHFKTLLWVEEYKSDRDLERYDVRDATFTMHRNNYYLAVPGLAEKRPSVLIGDRILVQRRGERNGRWFEGRVHFVRQLEVGLRFHGSFRWSDKDEYHVRFKLNRFPVRRQHQALDTAFSEERILFPTDLPRRTPPRPSISGVTIQNALIRTNAPQLQAVVSIAKMPPGSIPLIIFGPPGTGKTITMVEAIRQVLLANSKAKVFACAPSNSAADLLASRLSSLGSDILFRFYAPSRMSAQVPDDLRAFTHTTADGHFSVPPLVRMKAFRVVVTTCVSASFAYGIGIPRGHYSHIFIDEAGQATEPEAFIAIKTMADSATNVILSGDPKQLGPIIRSDIARDLGLDISYLERLMNRECYDIQKGAGLSVVKLVKNFRSHPAILRFPNERFYQGELQSFADPGVMNTYLNSSYLPNPKFPVVFHAVSGKDDRESTSPSFFNIDESTLVKQYVTRLREDRKFRTRDEDIAVVAPYHAQCVKIRQALRAVADGVKVGSVEELQGQERPVIIISTVRSSKEFIEYDLRHTLGFVANPRRFNVAVTRAKALLIVIGDPVVLSLDPLWRSFLNYIHLNGGWMGPPITWDPNEVVDEQGGYDYRVRKEAGLDMSEFTKRMEKMALEGVRDDGGGDGGGVDRPWRDVE